MLTWIKEAHWGWKAVGGFVTGAGTIYGMVVSPLHDVERRLEVVEDQIKPVSCWVEAQIRDTDPLVCLVDTGDQ